MASGMTVTNEHRVRASLPQTFAYVDDHTRVPEWMFGVETFEPVGERDHGLGAVFDVVMHVGVPIRTRLEVVAWEQDALLEFRSVKGFSTDSRWTFEALGDDETLVTSQITYRLPFGPAGRVMGKVMEPAVARASERSSTALVRRVEESAARGPSTG
ncbi:SRPBCC family protein [Nocardioides marmoribigeumensis]|uniref:Membrane protein n=1 Tax=Nocardioides marmoribigeumensis TaxID=433649 RepID=A0ABU2BUK4_9ACTN|nr:SRPBCC family protein [Nocardioides marmoribigeumensis]MDR7362313.1 putative membrane protein [Nocardioides marmoribigeumensis]